MSDNKNEKSLVPNELIVNKILLIRNQKVMIDSDIAELYGVTTKRLNQQVNRNINRFPKHFMFELIEDEKNEVVANVLRNERAITMSIKIIEIFIEMREVLNTHKDLLLKMQEIQQKEFTFFGFFSKRAIAVNINIIRVFTKMREMLTDNLNIKLEIEEIKKRLTSHSKNIELVFNYLDELIEKKDKPRTKIGYKK